MLIFHLFLLQILFILLLIQMKECAVINNGIEIFITNPHVIQERDLSMEIRVDVSLMDTSNAGILDMIKNSKICINMNGRECSCSEESFELTKLMLSPSCISDESYWSSVSIIYDELYVVSAPVFVKPLTDCDSKKTISLVLPLYLDDLSRVSILLWSLRSIDATLIEKLYIFVPNLQEQLIMETLSGLLSALPFSSQVMSESVLFFPTVDLRSVYPYAIQMAIKLLASEMINTPFYLTLDADVLLLDLFVYSDIFQEKVGACPLAIYQNENRQDFHPDWWHGSENMLGIQSNNLHNEKGFSVTPALLSTIGSRFVLAQLRHLHGTRGYQSYWLSSFGKSTIWSEYTLYRITLDHLGIFDLLHVPDMEVGLVRLHCNDAWYIDQLPWRPLNPVAGATKCIFSVVQSSTGVSPSTVYTAIVNPG